VDAMHDISFEQFEDFLFPMLWFLRWGTNPLRGTTKRMRILRISKRTTWRIGTMPFGAEMFEFTDDIDE
jgi:hypothetical protein